MIYLIFYWFMKLLATAMLLNGIRFWYKMDLEKPARTCAWIATGILLVAMWI